MPAGRSESGDGEESTPPTRSYVDALLHGNLSADQVASLRAEIASRAEEEAARLARSYPPPSPRAAPHSSGPPNGPVPAAGRVPSWPAGPRTRPLTGPPAEPSEDEGQRTVVRTYIPPEALPDEDEQRTVMRAALSDAVDDDDQRTRAHASYAPSSPPAADEAPFSFEPPADIGEPYVFDDDPPGEDLTAVRGPASLGSPTIDLGDLGDFEGAVTSPGRAAPSSAPRPSPEYDTLLEQTFLVALGGVASVPSVALPPARVTELPLGPQVAFVLSRLDGMSSVDDVLDMSAFPRLETLRILYDLLQQGVIRVEGGG
jgi:hypothetical protein